MIKVTKENLEQVNEELLASVKQTGSIRVSLKELGYDASSWYNVCRDYAPNDKLNITQAAMNRKILKVDKFYPPNG